MLEDCSRDWCRRRCCFDLDHLDCFQLPKYRLRLRWYSLDILYKIQMCLVVAVESLVHNMLVILDVEVYLRCLVCSSVHVPFLQFWVHWRFLLRLRCLKVWSCQWNLACLRWCTWRRRSPKLPRMCHRFPSLPCRHLDVAKLHLEQTEPVIVQLISNRHRLNSTDMVAQFRSIRLT